MKSCQSRRALRAWTPFYVFAGLAALVWIICAPGGARAGISRPTRIDRANGPVVSQIAQSDDQGDDTGVPADQVAKYIAVYKAMQRNRGLTVEKAAAQQGMTVEQFRDLENRVQRDDAAMQHVRDELQASAAHAPVSSPIPH